MDGADIRPKELSDQPYIEISQVDDASAADGQNAEPSPESRDDAGKRQQQPPPPEGRPVILGTDARLWTSLIHVLPLTISVFIITINIQRLYWFSEVDGPGFLFTTEGLGHMLQLVAKVYELLVIASLGALTLKVFKRRLVESHLPLGLLTGAYRVGDVPYIFSGYFWRAVHKAGVKTSQLLALLVLGNTLLSTLVGPSSAILLVPQLDWYPLPGAFNKVQHPVFFYNSPTNSTWPRVLNAAVSSGHHCDSFVGWWASWCPSGGFVDLSKWLAEWESSDLSNDLIGQDPTGAVRRRLSARGNFRDGTSVMTTISIAPLLTIGRLLNFIKWDNQGAIYETNLGAIYADDKRQHPTPQIKLTTSSESTIFQPIVQSQCTSYDLTGLSRPRHLPFYEYDQLNCLGDPACESMRESTLERGRGFVVTERLWNNPNISDSIGQYHFGAPNSSEPYPLLLASITLPYRNGTKTGVGLFACAIMAHWMPATLSVSPKDSDIVQSNVTNFISGADDLNLLTGSAGPAIKIEEDWIDFLAPMINVSTPSGNMTRTRPVRLIFDAFLADDMILEPAGNLGSDNPWQNLYGILKGQEYVQKAFTGMVTEALARVAPKSRSYMVNSYNNTIIEVTDIGTHRHQRDAVKESATWSNGTVVEIQPRDPDFLFNKFKESILSHLGYIKNTSNQPEFVGYNGLYSSPQEFVDYLSNLTHLEFEVERYGYGSGKGGPTMTFALTVVITYMIVVGTYFLYVMVLSKFWFKSDIPTIRALNRFPLTKYQETQMDQDVVANAEDDVDDGPDRRVGVHIEQHHKAPLNCPSCPSALALEETNGWCRCFFNPKWTSALGIKPENWSDSDEDRAVTQATQEALMERDSIGGGRAPGSERPDDGSVSQGSPPVDKDIAHVDNADVWEGCQVWMFVNWCLVEISDIPGHIPGGPAMVMALRYGPT
ncbi:hypothetical protein N657DRAFT_673261 [Parathielavia appendiculata]|uniref:Uncharacterized protein n=1 Tax=Parathielavia appendiculata TaxID=2587402 RepID=A0AAN6TWI6_9PEZI|nr:hypothetical protein N657DRAFT_673261 [Parathielavia appendiculata]